MFKMNLVLVAIMGKCLNWNMDKDIFVFEFSDVAESALGLVYTKWNILKISASFFNPWGLVCPVALEATLLFPELRELKVDWDEIVDGDAAKNWDRFLKDLNGCGSICMPRFVLSYVREKMCRWSCMGFVIECCVYCCCLCKGRDVGQRNCEFVEY